jgi:pimeloyl-ACP methyl ester carboxylesterase
MATARVNGVRLHYELGDAGNPPLVLVHGSWESLHDWDPVVEPLSKAFRVLRYDRRGHSQSERPPGQGSVRDDVRDLAALVEHLNLAPAWLVGNSFGAGISVRCAAKRPDLFRGLLAHEPPLLGLLGADATLAPMLTEVMRRVGAVVERIDSGDHAGAAEQFVEEVALGPGMWARIPEQDQRTMIENARTFLDEVRDPDALTLDLTKLRTFAKPTLLTKGDASPPPFAPVIGLLAATMPHAEVVTLSGAGHVPHQTHPETYVATILDFIRRHDAG